MRVAFRCDASIDLGTGHVMRCLALADGLVRRGVEVRFVCRQMAGDQIERLRAHGFETIALAYRGQSGSHGPDDSVATIAALDGFAADWLIVDHYGLDAVWERAVGASGPRILAIDDLADRAHDCDALLDQNFFRDGADRYRDLVPGRTSQLLGPRYALLGVDYARLRVLRSAETAVPKRLLLSVGGSDRQNLTTRFIRLLQGSAFRHLAVDAVIGPNHEHAGDVEALAGQRSPTYVHHQPDGLADLLRMADIAIGGGGTTNWERLCMGTPTLVVSLAANQVQICEELQQAGLIHYLGDAASLDDMQAAKVLAKMIADPAGLQREREAGQLLVDGLGVQRISEFLEPTPRAKLTIRAADAKDMGLYFGWANDPLVRAHSIHQGSIGLEGHRKWFAARLASKSARLFVMEASGLPVGQVRFEQSENVFDVDFSLDPLVRGRNWGAQVIWLGAKALAHDRPQKLRAIVKVENKASLAIFRRLGFTEMDAGAPGLRLFECLSDKLQQF